VSKNNVVCIGLTVADVLARPVDLNFQNRDTTFVDEISYAVGGDAFNEAYTLSRLGIPVKLIASVGCDIWGDFIIKTGNEAGIDMEHVIQQNDYPTTVSIVVIRHEGERNFICCRDSSAMHFVKESLDIPSVEKAKIVSLASLYTSDEMDQAFLEAARAGKKAGAIITADTTLNMEVRTLESRRELFSLVDFIFPNYEEACGITGETTLDGIANAFLKFGVKNVVIKTGKNGCYIQNADEKLNIPAYKNAKLVDTTGAGDNFAAGFIYGLYNDLPIHQCAAYANATAAVSIQYLGAGGVKRHEEVEEMMTE